MKNKKLIFPIIVAILAVLAVFAYQKYGKVEPVNPNNGNNPIISNENYKYKGETVLETDGWKKYTNPYWGIEFRFQDKENKVEVEGGDNGIRLIGEQDDYIYIYIGNIHSLDKITLKQYIEERKAWDYWQMNGELISIKEITNKNNLTFTETSVDYGKFISKTYFIEYPKNGKDFLKIYIGTDRQLLQEVVDSFRFIDLSSVKPQP